MIREITSDFPTMYRDELESRLAEWLFKWKSETHSGIHNPRAYLTRVLFRKAAKLVTNWRRREQPFVEMTAEPSDVSAPQRFSGDERVAWAREQLSHMVRRLANWDRHLIKVLKEHNWNVSRVARLLHLHRNTIHRRIRRIIREKCPIENESAPVEAAAIGSAIRGELMARLQDPLASAREQRRTRVLLALMDGLTYAEITIQFGVSAATIARWRRWLRHTGAASGGNYQGRGISRARLRLETWLRARTRKVASVRALARRFGLGKSTVQRVLRLRR